MAVTIDDIARLKDKEVYETSNEKIVLENNLRKVVTSPEFTILGFLNGYMYTRMGEYLTKHDLDGEIIGQIRIEEIEHASFREGSKSFFVYNANSLYKVTHSLEIEWQKDFFDKVRSVTIDMRGSIYVTFSFGATIVKYLDDGTEVTQTSDSGDPLKETVLYNTVVSKGAGWLYVIGTEYWGSLYRARSFIDKYDLRQWKLIDRQIFAEDKGIHKDNLNYQYDKFYLTGDYYYIYGRQYISKINIKAVEFWKHTMGYNSTTDTYDTIDTIEYDDNIYREYLYFAENLESSNGYSFGKLTTGGKVLWRITLTDCDKNADFQMCVYREQIYTTLRKYIKNRKGYILALDDNRVLFSTRDKHLIEIIEYNDKELYAPENYYGMYILAKKIKEGIDKIIYVPLRHDHGDILGYKPNNDLGDNLPKEEFLILLEEENPHYTDDESYDYSYLLASQYDLDPNEFSILFTNRYRPIVSRLRNFIKTKQPYLPDRMYQHIINIGSKMELDHRRITSMQDMHIIRSRFYYSYDRYLLADRHMFFTEIITKDLELTIITKKHGYEIVKKTREVYKYIFSRYTDINLLEEWLKENGVTDTELPEYVDELRHHTLDMIQDIQVAGVPVQYDVQFWKQHEWTYNGFEYYNNTWGNQIFTCTNLPWDKRRCQKRTYIDGLANIIRLQEMRPVLFFLNGKPIKWSDCTIVRDWSYSYLIVQGTDPYENDLSCIMFPCDIRYGEDNDCLPEEVCNTHFYFDNEGHITQNREDVNIRVEIIDKNIVGETLDYSKGYIEVKNEYNQRASERNIFVFENDILFPESRYYIQDHDKDIFTYLREDVKDTAVYKTFYWIKANKYYGTLYKIPNASETKDIVIDGTVNNKPTPAIDDFRPPFNFRMYRDRKWEDNLAKAVAYIMGYDMSLLINYYKKQSQIKSYIFHGDDLIHRVPVDGGWLVMPRARKQQHDDFIMVFRNDHLYEYYKEIIYDGNNFKIPIFNHVDRDDIIEVVHFRLADNSYYHLTIDEGFTDYISENLRYDNFLLFGNSASGQTYYDKFLIENSMQFPLQFEYRNKFDNNKYIGTDIVLEDKYYEGKEINICTKNQFHYMYYNIFKDRDTFSLSPDFRFCHDKSKYMVFKDWLILPKEEYEILTMSNENPTRRHIQIRFRETLHEGEKIDIFYLPMSYDEIDITGDVDWNNYAANKDILISNEHLGYSFDKDLFMIALKNHKINYTAIENVDNHRFRLLRDMLHVNDDDADRGNKPHDIVRVPEIDMVVRLYRFMQPDKLLGKLFSYSDTWSNAVDSLTINDYTTLLTRVTKS